MYCIFLFYKKVKDREGERFIYIYMSVCVCVYVSVLDKDELINES